MAASVVQICNEALSYLGQARINDIEDDTNEARACNLHYETLRDRELEAFAWHHIISRQILAAVTNTRTKEWKYSYAKPALTTSIITVFDTETGPTDPPHEYLLEGSTIWTNVKDANIVFAGTSTNPAAWSALFRDAISWALAARTAMSLTEDRDRAKDARDQSLQTMSQAQAHDLRVRKEMQTYTRMSPAIMARLGLDNPGWVDLRAT